MVKQEGEKALQRVLQRLTAAGILLREARGREVYFRASRECPIYADLRGSRSRCPTRSPQGACSEEASLFDTYTPMCILLCGGV
jgi:hypothetical protein